MMTDTYYADTAYDSTRPRDPSDRKDVPQLNRKDVPQLSGAQRQLPRQPLPHGVHCGELQAVSTMPRGLEGDKNRQATEALHERYVVKGPNNPVILIEMLIRVAAFFALFGGGAGILVFGLLRPSILISPPGLMVIGLFLILPSGIYILGRLLLHYDLISDKNNTIYNRRTGFVTRTWDKAPMDLPFAEFDGYMYTIPTGVGSTGYVLNVAHRFSDDGDESLKFFLPWQVALWWEFLQHYMDTSKPLPDIPEMEPYRALDPVTAQHDRRTGRPPDYWARMSPEEVDRRHAAAFAAASSYPWGKTREQALASGWRPSSEVLEEQTRVEDTRNDFEAVLAGLTGVLSGHPPVAQARWQSDLDTKSGALRYRISLLPAHDIIGGASGLDQAKKAVREALPPDVQSMVEIRIDETPDGELFYRRAS